MLLARYAERGLQAPARAYLVRGRTLADAGGAVTPAGDESLIPVLLDGARDACVVSAGGRNSYYPLLSTADRTWIDREDIAVLMPVAGGRRRGDLLALVALGSRRNALGFSDDDLRLLRAAAAAAGLACDALEPTEEERSSGRRGDDELAVECTRCARVAEWNAGMARCGCGGDRWELGVVPKRLAQRFDVTHRLGAGGMGVVYRAVDLELGRDVAVKTLTRLSDRAARHLMQEARIMGALSHPHIAVLYGTEQWRNTPLLIMEHLAGGSLAGVLRRGPLAPAEAVSMVRKLALALEYVHHAGQYHGDVKPSNIGFAAGMTPKFLDFGLAQALREVAEEEGAAARGAAAQIIGGTPAYLSPEVLSGAAPGPALDLWALSLVLWECVAGTHPFAGRAPSGNVARAVRAAVATLHLSVPASLSGFFESALSPDPSQRPPTAAALVEALDRLDIECTTVTTP